MVKKNTYIIKNKERNDYYVANGHWGGINNALCIAEGMYVAYKKTVIRCEEMIKIEETGKLTVIQ